ncbi:acyltransferase [Curtobacterium sp. MCBD17_021]|uniref:acyltransferase family protein n=1 Tax=Curtobacterium sp. MCBD17_021 TaxID=2175665 RepID=UPI000DA7D4CA|nr:acyltransferase [Curtobacterium sp. MCBD17_021]PZE66878.1 acyltransferase [Curtobacterium sp. MCBD17_021]
MSAESASPAAAGTTSTRSRPQLSPGVRAGLDLARALAAVYVVAYHVLASVAMPRPLSALFSFGQEAVIVFFLLSGFVIFANEADRSARPGGYYLRRLRRIYPPILLAMALSTVLWAFGLIRVDPSLWSAVGTMLSLQDIPTLKPGVVTAPYLGNDPLWSLSYEVFFYLVFPLVMVAWRRNEQRTRALVPVVAVAAFASYIFMPNHLSLVIAYFLLWWSGAMAAHVYLRTGTIRVGAVKSELLGLVSLTLVALAGVAVHGWNGAGLFPGLMVRHFAIALLLALVLVTPARTLLGKASLTAARPAAAVASVSYGLYVLHYPLLVQPNTQHTAWFLPAVAALIALAWVADRGLPKLLPRAPR